VTRYASDRAGAGGRGDRLAGVTHAAALQAGDHRSVGGQVDFRRGQLSFSGVKFMTLSALHVSMRGVIEFTSHQPGPFKDTSSRLDQFDVRDTSSHIGGGREVAMQAAFTNHSGGRRQFLIQNLLQLRRWIIDIPQIGRQLQRHIQSLRFEFRANFFGCDKLQREIDL
jgi:hypothetical protein